MWALVDFNVVAEPGLGEVKQLSAETEPPFEVAGPAHQWIECGDSVDEGWVYDDSDGTFSDPNA